MHSSDSDAMFSDNLFLQKSAAKEGHAGALWIKEINRKKFTEEDFLGNTILNPPPSPSCLTSASKKSFLKTWRVPGL